MSPYPGNNPLRLLLPFLSLLTLIPIISTLNLPDTTTNNLDNSTTLATCAHLSSLLPNRISYPSSSIYTTSLQTYYSAQERALTPSCIFTPTSTADVSLFLSTITAGNFASIPDFAIRSGGHKYFAGAANIAGGGITVDMRGMHDVTFNSDASVVSIGGGAVWSEDVYQHLVARNLTAAGARLPGIGIGGFVLGGGITFLARLAGFACDTVLAYEIVLASGLIVTATSTSHHDLFLALHGGSNNFGIVTRFDMTTYPSTGMLGGVISFNYTSSVLDAQANAFAGFMEEGNFDEKAMMGVLVTYEGGVSAVANSLFYLDPVAKPRVYEPFFEIGGQVADKLLVKDVGSIVDAFGAFTPPALARAAETTYTISHGTNPHLYTALFASYNTSLTTLTSASIPGSGIQWLLQPLPLSPSPSSNSFSLPPSSVAKANGAVIASIVVGWNNEADDEYMLAFLKTLHDNHVEILKEQDVWDEFVYLNYADGTERVFDTWGEGGKRRLQDVSRRYDPSGVFQKKVPGGFKLFTA